MMLLTTVYRILMAVLLVAFMQSQADGLKIPCQKLGGNCFPREPSNGLQCANATGCQEDEICCLDPALRDAPEFGCRTTYCCWSAGGHCVSPWSDYDDYDYFDCYDVIPGLCGGSCICCISDVYYTADDDDDK